MARPFQEEGYDEILKFAKEEFLDKGFREASLRNIAEKAGVTTGFIYSRFKNKEELFNKIVSPTLDNFYLEYENFMADYFKNDKLELIEEREKTSTGELFNMVDKIYDNIDIFKLLVSNSTSIKYENYIDKIIKVEEDSMMEYISRTKNKCFENGRLSKELLHILVTAFFNGVFEIVIHSMPRERANIYIGQLSEFYHCGWKNIFQE